MSQQHRRASQPEQPAPPVRPSVWQYVRLMRLPNVLTALADVLMGFLFVHHRLQPMGVLLCLALASAQLYLAGMVLNDVCDIRQDRRQRPDRPLPSGAIGLAAARRLGWSLLICGVAWGLLASVIGVEISKLAWRSGVVAALLALCVVLYNFQLKRTPAGPLAMGACRALNVLLGMAVAPAAAEAILFGYTAAQLLVAGAIGLYIVGVTWLARSEAATSSRLQLAGATLVMMWGITLLALLYDRLPPGGPRPAVSEQVWYVLLGLLGLTLVRRCGRAISQPTGQQVQVAVTTGIWSLIVLDAAVALLVAPPPYAILIVSLLVPTMVLGQWIRAT